MIDKIRKLLGLKPRKHSYAQLATDAATTVSSTTKGIFANMSFALLMAGLGLCAALIYLLFIFK